ncbi:HAD hydrolase family protein [Lactiplantibacillus plantarum]|nr:HAD hydrolase family protein [Lactiplantibacillus plantarum]
MVQTITGKIITGFYSCHMTITSTLKRSAEDSISIVTLKVKTIYTANRNISPYTVGESALVNMPIRFRTPEEMRPDLPIVKCMFIDHGPLLDAAIKQLPASFSKRFTIVRSEAYFLEFMNPAASKGNASATLTDHLNLTADEVMAIGDQGNDLSARYATNSVA